MNVKKVTFKQCADDPVSIQVMTERKGGRFDVWAIVVEDFFDRPEMDRLRNGESITAVISFDDK